MGQTISEDDMENVQTFAKNVVSLAKYRQTLYDYLGTQLSEQLLPYECCHSSRKTCYGSNTPFLACSLIQHVLRPPFLPPKGSAESEDSSKNVDRGPQSCCSDWRSRWSTVNIPRRKSHISFKISSLNGSDPRSREVSSSPVVHKLAGITDVPPGLCSEL